MQQPSFSELGTAVALARTAFGLKVENATPIPSWNSTVFRLDTASGRYALRLHRPGIRPEGHIRGELALLRDLHSQGLRVPEPVATSTGQDLLLDHDSDGSPRSYDLTRWLEGTVRRQRHGLDTTDAQRLGETLGDIHLASRAFPCGLAERPTFGDAVWVLTEATTDHLEAIASWISPEDMALLEHVVSCIQPALNTLSSTERKPGAIHNDFILGNCLWHQGDLGVVDFADWGVGPYLYDLAPMLTNIGDRPRMHEAFLAGYDSRVPLSAAQEAVLPLLEAVRHVSFCLHNVDKARRGLSTHPWTCTYLSE